MHDKIFVTKSYLPSIEDYTQYLEKIWESGQLTNQGPILKEFERQVKQYLNVDTFHFVTNGTLALQLALRAIDINPGDEIITTPFSYVATTSAILWERATPIFVDVEAESFNIDPKLIEGSITPKTKAILAVHVFGRPCDTEAIEEIAKKHGLRVIYDAAHAFGIETDKGTLLAKGDISICSFHATKVFHTIEGGGLVVNDPQLSDKIELLKRFGHEGDQHYMLGMNAKASEFQAAMGLSLLPLLPTMIQGRKLVHDQYTNLLDSETVSIYRPANNVVHNYSYYPVVFSSSELRAKVLKRLENNNIIARRYFYPALNTLPYLEYQPCEVAEELADRIVCLPMYPGLEKSDVDKISGIINEVISEH